MSGAPLVIDTNWERVSSMVTVWMHRPWLSSYEIVQCPWKQILYFTEEKISSEVYTCCKISENLENIPHENVWIFTISWISGAFSSIWQVKSWLVPQTEELMSQESKKRKEKFIFAILVQLFRFSFHFIVCNKYHQDTYISEQKRLSIFNFFNFILTFWLGLNTKELIQPIWGADNKISHFEEKINTMLAPGQIWRQSLPERK